jgi:hypothetical protein
MTRFVGLSRYRTNFAHTLSAYVLSEAKGRSDATSKLRAQLAYDDAQFGRFDDLLASAKPQTLGYAWQNSDLAAWHAAGHEADNYGNRSGADGLLCGKSVGYKVSRLSITRRFLFIGLPSPRSKVVNVLLFAADDADFEHWPVFVGTTAELKRAATELRRRNPDRRATVNQDRNGDWSFSASAREIALFAADLPGFMTVADYVASRNGCSHC